MITKTKKSLFVASIALMLSTAHADKLTLQAPHLKAKGKNTEQLVQALSKAYQQNPDIHAGLRAYYAAVEAIPAAKAGWLPTINLVGKGTHSKSLSNGTSTISNQPLEHKNASSDSLSITAQLNQNLYSGGNTLYNLDAAKASVKNAEMKFVSVEQKLFLDAIKAYLNLWKAYETLKYLKASVGFNVRTVAETDAQMKVGEKTRTDLADARSNLADALAQQYTAEATVDAAKAVYEEVIGENAPESLSLPELLVDKSQMPKNLDEIQKLAIKQSPSLLEASYAEKAQKAAVGVAESALLPKLDFNASGSRDKSNNQSRRAPHGGTTTSSPSFSYTNTGTLGVTLTVPLFQGGAKWSATRKANQVRYQALSTLKKTHLGVTQAVSRVWSAQVAAEAALKQRHVQVQSARLNHEGRRQEYLVGEKSLTQTLDAQRFLVNAQVKLVAQQFAVQENFYQLVSLYGGLLPGALSLPVDRHDILGYRDAMSGKIFGTGDLRAPDNTKD